jgi:hypothetical protein
MADLVLVRSMRSLSYILLVSLALCCAAGSPQTTASNMTLPSGRQIQIISMVPMHFPKGPDGLILNCHTDIPMTDMPQLRGEVDEIWKTFFQKEVERAKMTAAAIRISHPEATGPIYHAKGYGFVFEKRADGQWHCVNDDNKQ